MNLHSLRSRLIDQLQGLELTVILKINLILGTYLIRQRANGQFALMLKCEEKPKGVKSMKIEEEVVDETKFYYLSQARKFTSLVKMVSYYRHKDLTENFNYEALRGVTLRTPYKDI